MKLERRRKVLLREMCDTCMMYDQNGFHFLDLDTQIGAWSFEFQLPICSISFSLERRRLLAVNSSFRILYLQLDKSRFMLVQSHWKERDHLAFGTRNFLRGNSCLLPFIKISTLSAQKDMCSLHDEKK